MNKLLLNELNNLPNTYFFDEAILAAGKAPARKEILNMLKNFVNLNDVEVAFASRNKAKDCFWYTPSCEVLNKDFILILNDFKNKEVDFIYIEKYTLQPKQLKTRLNNNNKVCLHLELVKENGYIVDSKSKYNFTNNHFLKRVSY